MKKSLNLAQAIFPYKLTFLHFGAGIWPHFFVLEGQPSTQHHTERSCLWRWPFLGHSEGFYMLQWLTHAKMMVSPQTDSIMKYLRSRPLKYARDFILDPFLWFFPIDSLGAVLENPCADIRGVRFTVCPVYRGTTVTRSLDLQREHASLLIVLFDRWHIAR